MRLDLAATPAEIESATRTESAPRAADARTIEPAGTKAPESSAASTAAEGEVTAFAFFEDEDEIVLGEAFGGAELPAFLALLSDCFLERLAVVLHVHELVVPRGRGSCKSAKTARADGATRRRARTAVGCAGHPAGRRATRSARDAWASDSDTGRRADGSRSTPTASSASAARTGRLR